MIGSFKSIGQVKGDNTIIIKTGMSSEDAFKALGRHLVSVGWTLDKTDNNFLTISTGARDARSNNEVLINAVVLDSGYVKIKAKWKFKGSALAGVAASSYYDWEWGKRDVITPEVVGAVSSFGISRLFRKE